MCKVLVRYFLLFFAVVIFSCKNEMTPGIVHEDPYDTNRLVKTQLGAHFDEPLEIAVAPDGRVVIIERKGAVKIYVPSANEVKRISSSPVFFRVVDGLLGVALDPHFDTNHFI